MGSPTVVNKAFIKRCLERKLLNEVSWPDYVAITNDSMVYSPPERSSPDDVPVHFGFERESDTLKKVIEESAVSLLGEPMLKGCLIPYQSGEPGNLSTFGSLLRVVQQRLNSLVVRTIANQVVLRVASEYLNIDPDELIGSDPPPDWIGDTAFNEFISKLSQALKVRLPELDEQIINSETRIKIRKSTKLNEIRDILLKDVVKNCLDNKGKTVCI